VNRKRKPAERRLLTGPIHGRIEALRDKAGLTQQQLADLVGVDKTAVSAWERKLARPDIRHLAAVAKALKVTLDDLIRGEEQAA
jgi:transcriptional regulator with XRE-family HTH domain